MTDYHFSGRQKDIIVAQSLRADCALNLNGLYSFLEPPDPARIAKAIEVVSEHFLSLRTKVGIVNGELVPCVFEGSVPVRQITRTTARAQFDEIYQKSRSPFDLFSERPIRAFLLGDGEQIQHMLLQFHHVATDWWSFRIIHKALTAVYENGSNTKLPIDNLSLNNEKSLCLESSTASMRHWNRLLQEPVFTRSCSFGAGSVHRERAVNVDVKRLEALAREEKLTLFEWLFMQFGKAVTDYTHQDTLINIPVGNRSEITDIQTVGYLMNVVPIRCRVTNGRFDKEATLAALRGGITHGRTPRSYLAQILRKTIGQYSPLFDIVFMFLRDGIGGLDMPGNARFTRIYPGKDEDHFVVTMRELNGELTIVAEGSTNDELGAAAITRFLNSLEES